MTEVSEDTKLKIEKFIDEDINSEKIKANPILYPISEIMGSWNFAELQINKELFEVKKAKDEINNLMKLQSIYSQTDFGFNVINYKRAVSSVIQSQNLEIDILRNCIKKMLEIVNIRYNVIIAGEKSYSDKEIDDIKHKEADRTSKTFEITRKELDLEIIKIDNDRIKLNEEIRSLKEKLNIKGLFEESKTEANEELGEKERLMIKLFETYDEQKTKELWLNETKLSEIKFFGVKSRLEEKGLLKKC